MLRVYNISNIFPSSFAQQGKLEAVCFQQSQATLHHRLFLFVTPSVTTFKVVFHLSYKPELPRLMPVSFASCVVCSDRAVGSVWQHICTVLSFIFTRQPPLILIQRIIPCTMKLQGQGRRRPPSRRRSMSCQVLRAARNCCVFGGGMQWS